MNLQELKQEFINMQKRGYKILVWLQLESGEERVIKVTHEHKIQEVLDKTGSIVRSYKIFKSLKDFE
jgi:hypothetical protein